MLQLLLLDKCVKLLKSAIHFWVEKLKVNKKGLDAPANSLFIFQLVEAPTLKMASPVSVYNSNAVDTHISSVSVKNIEC